MSKTLSEAVRDLGRSARLQTALALPDAQLLEQFVLRRDETAFEALLHRHGPLVFGVCRRLLYNRQDAEDAFQATFLVLARKAGAISRRALLANWLYGVAYRVATRARKEVATRGARQRSDIELAEVPAAGEPVAADSTFFLHEEVEGLPDKYRRPVVLCYLEGKSNEEAALQLRWPVGTVKGRLHRARQLLRVRLSRRGVALPAGVLATTLAPATLSAALVKSTTTIVRRYMAGGGVSASVAALMKGVLQTMLLDRLKQVAMLVVVVALLGGVGGFVYRALATGPAADQKETPKPVVNDPAKDEQAKVDKDAVLAEKQKETPNEGVKDPAKSDANDKDAIQGVWKVARYEGEPGADYLLEFSKWVITSKEISYGDRGHVYTYTIDPARKPKALELTTVGKGANEQIYRAIYELSGDTLKVRIPHGNPAERPKNMKPDGAAPVCTFQREKPPAKPKEDKVALQGAWRLVECEGPEGKIHPKAFDAWHIVGDRIIQVEGKNYLPGPTYSLRQSVEPKAIDLAYDKRGETKIVKAIYELDGDTLKLCVSNASSRPAKVAAGHATHVYIFRREYGVQHRDDKVGLQGTWTVQVVLSDGVDVSGIVTDHDYGYYRGSKWVVAGDRVSMGESIAMEELIYQLDPAQNPKAIDLLDARYAKEKEKTYLGLEKPKDHTKRGVYVLDGDTWTICVGWPNRPAELVSKKGDRTMLIVLRHEPREDRGKILGSWHVSGIHANGKDVRNEAGEPRLLGQARWTFTADKLTIEPPGKTLAFTYRLDPAARPKTMDLTVTAGPDDQKGKTRLCVYDIEGDALRLCLPFETAAKRPTELSAKEGNKAMLIELRRPVN
jgi:RNA polymerase sigma factor (sigma-70 family)